MKKRGNPDSEPNIRRIDSKRNAQKQTHGFQVHFLRGDQAVTRMFSDSVFGGKEGARRAARKFKREAIGELPERVFRGPLAAKQSSTRKSSKSASKSTKAAKSPKNARSGKSAKKAPAKKTSKRR